MQKLKMDTGNDSDCCEITLLGESNTSTQPALSTIVTFANANISTKNYGDVVDDDCCEIISKDSVQLSSNGDIKILSRNQTLAKTNLVASYVLDNNLSDVSSFGLCPSTSSVPAKSIKLIKSPMSKKEANERVSLDDKIAEVERWKFECMKQIKNLEHQELHDSIEGELILEKIDKLRKKVVQFEESLSKFIYYEDAQYDELKDEKFCVNNGTFIMETDLEPLNSLLTYHINELVTGSDIRAGYRCVTVNDVEEMLKVIRERGDCLVYDIVVPKDKENFESFVLQIVEMTNFRCRQNVFKQFMDEEYGYNVLATSENVTSSSIQQTSSIQESSPILQEQKVIYENSLSETAKFKPTFSTELLVMKSVGLLNSTDEEELAEVIDLSDSGEDDRDTGKSMTVASKYGDGEKGSNVKNDTTIEEQKANNSISQNIVEIDEKLVDSNTENCKLSSKREASEALHRMQERKRAKFLDDDNIAINKTRKSLPKASTLDLKLLKENVSLLPSTSPDKITVTEEHVVKIEKVKDVSELSGDNNEPFAVFNLEGLLDDDKNEEEHLLTDRVIREGSNSSIASLVLKDFVEVEMVDLSNNDICSSSNTARKSSESYIKPPIIDLDSDHEDIYTCEKVLTRKDSNNNAKKVDDCGIGNGDDDDSDLEIICEIKK